jgi:hypothetical protein
VSLRHSIFSTNIRLRPNPILSDHSRTALLQVLFAAIDFAEKARRALKIILLVISSQLKHDKAYESLDWCLDRHFGRLHNERS